MGPRWVQGGELQGHTLHGSIAVGCRFQELKLLLSLQGGQKAPSHTCFSRGNSSPSSLGLGPNLCRPCLLLPYEGDSGPQRTPTHDRLLLCENHMEVLIYSSFESKSFYYLSKSPPRTFLSFSGRKNELLYELFQRVSELLECYNMLQCYSPYL